MTTWMVLMAGLALGSDGTEQISTETEQRFAFDGYWDGVQQGIDPMEDLPITCDVKFEPGWATLCGLRMNFKWVDQGRGKCRLILMNGSLIYHGLYKRASGQLVICYGHSGQGRPTAFEVNKTQNLLILNPVKPPKK
jgi:hypothetical protein